LLGDDIRAMRAQIILADYQSKLLPIRAVSSANRRYPGKMKAFVDFFQTEFDLDPFVSA